MPIYPMKGCVQDVDYKVIDHHWVLQGEDFQVPSPPGMMRSRGVSSPADRSCRTLYEFKTGQKLVLQAVCLKKYSHVYGLVVFYWGLVKVNFYHIFLAYFTYTGAIIWLPSESQVTKVPLSCYQVSLSIGKPGNKTATLSRSDPYTFVLLPDSIKQSPEPC